MTGATEWIPWFMLVFVYGIDQIREHGQPKSIFMLMILAGFFFALSMYMNLKIGLFAMLLGGGYVTIDVFWFSIMAIALVLGWYGGVCN